MEDCAVIEEMMCMQPACLDSLHIQLRVCDKFWLPCVEE